MARDDSKALLWRAFMPLLDGAGPRGTRGWVSAVGPVVTRVAAGAGHWAAGQRLTALAIAGEAPDVAFSILRAASAEPLR